MVIDRRDFLRRAGVVAGAAALAPTVITAVTPALTRFGTGRIPHLAADSALDAPAAQAPFDTVVVVMMENRSFDHLLGWTGTDAAYLEAGRAAYGKSFTIDGKQEGLSYRDAHGHTVATHWLPGSDKYPYQGCGEGIPGHGWFAGRVQRDRGFLARGAGNSDFALGYYRATDMPLYDQLVRRFTTCDRWFSSLLGPTFPNRQYLHSAQSAGLKKDPGPLHPAMYSTPTIWDRLVAAQVPVGYYYTDLPILPLFGHQHDAVTHGLDQFSADAAAGTLANVVMVDPGFHIARRTDDHPVGDIRLGQRWLRTVFQAFAQSPQWERGVFVVLYDEWGGFFDHVRPPTATDGRASKRDGDNFGQLGFRVPAIVASPFARRGYADHTVYDHTSVLRMLEWRFLGAPASGGAAGTGSPWWLTPRDRAAANLAGTLAATGDPDLGFDVAALELPAADPPCTFGPLGGPMYDGDPFAQITQGFEDDLASKYPGAVAQPWLD
jgi:phospholipase C